MGGARGRERLFLLGTLVVLCSCSLRARFAQTAYERVDAGGMPPQAGTSAPVQDSGTSPTHDSGVTTGRTPPDPERDAQTKPVEEPEPGAACPESLEQRLTVSTIDAGVDVRYKRVGYDYFPLDESVIVSVSQNGRIMLAFRENNGNRVRVTRLSAQLTREGPDISVYAYDLGGLVAHDDGTFALLVRRDDPGEQLLDTTTTDSIGKAAFLVRLAGTRELFAQPLTGTASITRAKDPAARDCAPQLNGRLAWNGTKYGAYFAVHGCEGDPHESFYGDKLVYVDGEGNALDGGWGWNCSISQGMRLLSEPKGAFTSSCLSDNTPFAGLNLVTEGVQPRQLAPEKVAAGYVAGRFGSMVRMRDGRYVIAWLSRGVPDEMAKARRPNQAAKQAHDIASIQLGADRAPLGARTWLTETPEIAETNLHIAPYGPDRLLVVWDNVEALSCTEWTCWGTYSGTSARLADLNGKFLTPDVRIAAPPNSEQDIVVFPNGDLGWAFVPDDARNYAEPLPNNRGIPTVPVKRQLSFARLRYCE